MKINKEIPLIIIALLPLIYLSFLWNQLPEKVPMHWNLSGEIDRYGNKIELLILTLSLSVFVYLIFLILPKIDPKGKLNNMGNKFHAIKFIMVTFMSVLALFIIYSIQHQGFKSSNYILLLIGLLYMVLGNYFKTIKPNYFLGIRTPWTLENEIVWKKTHVLGGQLWLVGGIIVIISSIFINEKINFIIFMLITGIIAIIPIAYSYIKFKQEKNEVLNN